MVLPRLGLDFAHRVRRLDVDRKRRVCRLDLDQEYRLRPMGLSDCSDLHDPRHREIHHGIP